ncbi:MAG: hypothetical protein ACTSSK_00275 [Candidatus Heimdallarchaeota archaeon]
MQKKYLIKFSILSVLILMSSFTPTVAQISVGDTLYYKVVTSRISAEVGANSVSSKVLIS